MNCRIFYRDLKHRLSPFKQNTMPTPFDTLADNDGDLAYSSDENTDDAVFWKDHRVLRFPPLDSPPAHKLSYDDLEESPFKGFNVLPANEGSTPQPLTHSQRRSRRLITLGDDMHTLPETKVFPREFFRAAIPVDNAGTTKVQDVVTQLVDLENEGSDTEKSTLKEAVRESEGDAGTTKEQDVVTQLVDLENEGNDTKKSTTKEAVRESGGATARATRNRLRALAKRKRKLQDRNAANMRHEVLKNLQKNRQARLKADLSLVQDVPDWFFDKFE